MSPDGWIRVLRDAETGVQPTDSQMKACCADFYASDWAQMLLGDSFHPGGTGLTDRLAGLLSLRPGERVLDLACGMGKSAIHVANRFGVRVVGVDYGESTIERAREAARDAGVAAEFIVGDAERLEFDDASFDAVISECSFCVLPDTAMAAREIERVLRPGGRAGISDICRDGDLPPELETAFGQVACIADATRTEDVVAVLTQARLQVQVVERHDDALADLVRDVGGRLMALEVGARIGRLQLPEGIDFDEARRVRLAAAEAVRRGTLGYAVITAWKPE